MEDTMDKGELTKNITLTRVTDIPVDQREKCLDEIMEVEKSAWPPELQGERSKFESRMQVFPEGIVLAMIDGEVKGFSTSQITTYDPDINKTWDEITDNGTLVNTHNPSGDSLYVASVAVGADAQGNGLGAKLVKSQEEFAAKMGLMRLYLGARIPGYDEYCKENGEISVDDYLALENGNGEPLDPEIRFYQRQGLYPAKVIPNFEPDGPSRDYGVVLVWKNPQIPSQV